MESNPTLLRLGMINQELVHQQSLSDEKLELRLGPTPSCCQKRVAPPSVIGWPPVRSFRKKIAASNSTLKPPLDLKSDVSEKEDNGELKLLVKGSRSSPSKNQMFVKINMEGVPIGRKVNLMNHDSYESLFSAVDHLFRCLLLAQGSGGEIKMEEYTVVYEDNEGDRVLVGDVPWNMFLSSVKRLRVLKRSELGAKHE